MAKLEWNNELSVGIETIDEQHKQWIAHFNDAAEAVGSAKGTGQIMATLGFLVDYTETHFATEEKAMEQSGYPGRVEHRAKHAELTETLRNLVSDFEEEGATHNLATTVETFLGNWLVKHIQEVDKLLGVYLKEKGVVVSGE